MPTQAPPFNMSTRQKVVPIQTITRPTGGGLTTIEIQKAGILQKILLDISVTIAGTLSAPNVYGLASVIRRVTLRVNGGNIIFDCSGAGFNYLIRDFLEEANSHFSWNDARLAVTTGTKNLSMVIPVALNSRDDIGLIMLQNEQTVLTLAIEWEADATVATGATITGTCAPSLVVLEPPSNPASLPALNTIHQCLEELVTFSASGAQDHQITRGATITGLYYLLPAITYSDYELRVQQSNVIYRFSNRAMQIWFDQISMGRDITLSGAIAGAANRIFLDFAASDMLGELGTVRDVLDTSLLTSVFSRITVSGAGVANHIRRQVLTLGRN